MTATTDSDTTLRVCDWLTAEAKRMLAGAKAKPTLRNHIRLLELKGRMLQQIRELDRLADALHRNATI